MNTPARQEMQRAEATERNTAANEVLPRDNQGNVINEVADGAVAEDGIDDRGSGRVDNNLGDEDRGGEPENKVLKMSPNDQKRLEMARRFRRPDHEESEPFNGDVNDPAVYGEVGRTHMQPDPDAAEPGVAADETEQRQEAQPAKKTYKLKIRNQEVELTEDEVLARASQVTAADTYLAEARELLEQAKTIRGERAAPGSRHPGDQNQSTQDDEQDDNREEAPRHPGARLQTAIEKIQFGDATEAAAELGAAIDEAADKKADERQLRRQMDNDLATSQKALIAFNKANPDLAADELAASAIEKTIYTIYREEIIKAGVDEAQIPKDSKTLADWHRFYRISGYEVSPVSKILEEAKGRFNKWRGVSPQPKPGEQQQRDPAAKPRVEVTVDRNARRQNIQTQPTRTVSPRPNEAEQPRERTRSSVIADMRKRRGQVTA